MATATSERRRRIRKRVEAFLLAHPKQTFRIEALARKINYDYLDVVAACRRLALEGKVFNPHPSRRGLDRVKKLGGLT